MPLKRLKYYRESVGDGEVNKLFHLFILFAIVIASILVLSVVGTVIYYAATLDLPTVETLKDYRPNIASTVYDDNNEIVDQFFLEDRKIVDINNVPKVVQHAFVSSEDSRFYQHKGFDIKSIFRAMFKNIEAGAIVQGGSTITQQVAKMMYLSPEKKYIRKLKEAILAYKIDKYLAKDQIIGLYLNQIYLGHGTYGIESASQMYFGKSSTDLNLPEAALLAGLPKAPSTYSPFLAFDRAKQRQLYVLNRMFEDGYISKEEMEKASAETIQLREIKEQQKVAAYFVENVRRYVQEKYGGDVLYKEGLSIYTTLNLAAQKEANDAVEAGLAELEDRQKYERGLVQGALLCMDAKTGAIRAMVGGRDFTKSEFNRATQSRRQPGSSFKPLIYTAAFDKGLNPSSVFVDSPIVVEDPTAEDGLWKPNNFDNKFLGPITMRKALVDSRNVVTVKILQEITPAYAASYAANMGITSPLMPTLSLALGSSGVTLEEMVRAYGVLANGGKKVTPYYIKKIVDRTGNVFEENTPQSEQVIDPRIAFMTSYIMRDVVETGTGRRVKSIGRPVGGKTGTTNDYRDAWFIGFTPSLVTGVWVGFDQEISLGKLEVGGKAAAPIWLYFMEKVLKGAPAESFPTPEGITFMRVDAQTGRLSTGTDDSSTIYECFLEGTKPSDKAIEVFDDKEDLFR